MRQKIILAIILSIIVFGGIGYYIYSNFGQRKEIVSTTESQNKTGTQKDINNLATTTVEVDYSKFENLILSGIRKKNNGDYKGAEYDWLEAIRLNPSSPVPFNNLADLYAYYLKDNKKAEEYFKRAVERGPNMIYIYRSYYEFCRYVLKDDEKAKSVLKQGIENNPNTSRDLKYLLDNY